MPACDWLKGWNGVTSLVDHTIRQTSWQLQKLLHFELLIQGEIRHVSSKRPIRSRDKGESMCHHQLVLNVIKMVTKL